MVVETEYGPLDVHYNEGFNFATGEMVCIATVKDLPFISIHRDNKEEVVEDLKLVFAMWLKMWLKGQLEFLNESKGK